MNDSNSKLNQILDKDMITDKYKNGIDSSNGKNYNNFNQKIFIIFLDDHRMNIDDNNYDMNIHEESKNGKLS
jgi:flagellar biosynthesis regulator FlaF